MSALLKSDSKDERTVSRTAKIRISDDAICVKHFEDNFQDKGQFFLNFIILPW